MKKSCEYIAGLNQIRLFCAGLVGLGLVGGQLFGIAVFAC